MARVINPAIRVALILQAVAAGIAGAQAVFLRVDRPIEETASAIPRAQGAFQNIQYAKSPEVLAASSRRADRPRQ
jgi:hypothetical protein